MVGGNCAERVLIQFRGFGMGVLNGVQFYFMFVYTVENTEK